MLSLAMAFSLAACGNSGNNGSSSIPSSISQASVSSEAPPVSNRESSAAIKTSDNAVSEDLASEDETKPETATVETTGENTASVNPTSNDTAKSNILIAYFGVPETDGVDAVAGASRVVANGQVLGNTQFIAETIQSSVGGDLFQIKTVQKYPGLHAPLVNFAKEEQAKDARPELSTKIDNMADYDVIFLGYPNWWADLPMPLYTFLETYDFSGKTIIPFCPHGGSGFSNTISAISKLQPNATVVTDGFTVSRDKVANSSNDVIAWVQGLDIPQ